MTIPLHLGYTIGRVNGHQTAVQRTLLALMGVSLPAAEAWDILPRVQEHKWLVSERLGRDVGWRVAAVDFFENVYEAREAKAEQNSLASKLRGFASRLGGLYLSHQSWKAHDGVFAVSAGDMK